MHTSGLAKFHANLISRRAPLQASNRLFLLDPAQFALRNKPAFAPHRAQDAALGDLLAKSLEQLFL